MEIIDYKALRLARNRERDRAYWAKPENKEKKRLSNRRWNLANPEKAKAARERWLASNPDVPSRAKCGLGQRQWLELFASQGHACASCGADKPGGQHWHTDHDHDTGVVRGILCWRCNVSLGLLGDNLDNVENSTKLLLAYLRRQP